MYKVLYRRAGEADVPESVEVFLSSVADMYARNGIGLPLPDRKHTETGYGHIQRTGIFHLAEVDGRIAAICHAVVRDKLWFLSGFWALPHLRQQKMGGTLLERVMDEGRRLGASTFFTWSSVDMTAMAVYMKKGMLPGYQILTFTGRAVDLSEERAGYAVEPLALATAMQLDARVRATRRETDHRFWLFETQNEGRQVLRDGRVVGYYYFSNHGTIGPAAWLDPQDAQALIGMACRDARERAEQVRLMIPGINHAAIRFALGAGLRLMAFSHLLTTSPFGRMEQYLSSGPLLF
ncbi:MAG TPA: GNAT family N-acetyltransferase [Pyrinomonadaceae bacterium]